MILTSMPLQPRRSAYRLLVILVFLAAQLLAVSGSPPRAQAGPAGPPSRTATQRYLYLPTLWRDPSIPEACNASSPWWKGTPGNPANYIFCSKQDLEYVAGWDSILHFNRGDTRDLSLKWNIFGINGIQLRIDPSTYCSGKAGYTGIRNVAVSGSDGPNNFIYAMNASEFGYDGFKIELYILNTQGETVGYNEKYFCVH